MPEFQDTAGSKEQEAKIFTFYRNKGEGERYFAPCYVEGLHAYDGEINLGYEKILAKGIVEFRNGIITIHPDFDLFSNDPDTVRDNEENRELMFDLDDIHEIKETKLPSLICKMGKSSRNNKRVLEGFQIYYPNKGPSGLRGEPMTQEEVDREKLAISICERYAILEENRPVIETLAYTRRKPTSSEVNVMPYRIYMDLGCEKEKKVNRGIEMINHSLAKPIGLLKDVLCQVRVTTIIAKFLILDIPIDRDHNYGRKMIPFYLWWSPGYNLTSYVYLRWVKRDKFGALTYGPMSAKYLNITEPKDRSLALHAALNPFH
ncbi:hypothetical protein Tco_1490976 [Tanacetum coccineum]